MYKILDSPLVYAISQHVLAPGAHFLLTRKVRKLAGLVSTGGRILDIGCGPSSWLSRIKLTPVGLDCSLPYISRYQDAGQTGVVATADLLPFRSHSFDSIWTIGLFHHLLDSTVAATLSEMARACRPGGHLVIIDAVMPRSPYRRPIAYVQRRADRGRFVRSEAHLLSLVRGAVPLPWNTQRFTYSLNGLEGIACWIQLGAS